MEKRGGITASQYYRFLCLPFFQRKEPVQIVETARHDAFGGVAQVETMTNFVQDRAWKIEVLISFL